MTTSRTDCRLCVDQMTPAGVHPVFGAVYRLCPQCCPACPQCGGSGLFPAHTDCFEHLVDAIDALGFDLDLCRGCLAITAIHPRTYGGIE